MKKTNNLHKNIAAIAGVGTALTFLGHGMWAAVEKNPKFIELITDSFDNLFGITVSKVTGSDWVQFIGVVDVMLAATFTLATIGLFASGGWLKRLSTSKLIVGLYAWAVTWGFVTALSRVTAAGTLYPEIWDIVERGPNFVLPLIGLLIVLRLRKGRSSNS